MNRGRSGVYSGRFSGESQSPYTFVETSRYFRRTDWVLRHDSGISKLWENISHSRSLPVILLEISVKFRSGTVEGVAVPVEGSGWRTELSERSRGDLQRLRVSQIPRCTVRHRVSFGDTFNVFLRKTLTCLGTPSWYAIRLTLDVSSGVIGGFIHGSTSFVDT